MQSDTDARVAASVATACDAIFTQAEKPRAGTDLDRAQIAATEAAVALERAEHRRVQLIQTVQDFNAATREIRRLDTDLPVLAAQKRALHEREVRVTALQARDAAERTANAAATENLRRLVDAETRVAELQRLISERTNGMRASMDQAGQLADAQSAARQRAEQLESAHASASEATRRQRQRRDLLQSATNRLEKAARLAELEAREIQVRKHQTELADMRQQLAALPALEPARLKKLQDRERSAGNADAVWKSMAAGVEVLKAAFPVEVGGALLAPGEMRILTDETEVTVGTTLKLRIRPGGGTGLVEARAEARKAQERLQMDLDALGLATLVEAQEVVVRRAALELRMEATVQWLLTLEADLVPQRLAEAKEAMAAAEDDVRTAEASEAARLTERDVAMGAVTGANEAVARHQKSLDRQLRDLEEGEAQLRLLHELHGDDPVRTNALATARVSLSDAEAKWNEIRQALAALQPELLEADAARVTRALEQTTRAHQEASTRLAVAAAALRLDGNEDPEADWAVASARAAVTAGHLFSVHTKASAIHLLHELFTGEQRALADQFTRPLAGRITGYLQCLFGPGARAVVTLSEGTFSGLQLSRSDSPDGTVPFDSLSGGNREQVAAAVRLAVAEILAADHGGTLPVVFDDAFAFSDPDRVQTLQRMLDLAAGRGLQVIVLTCTPSDYTALGARQVSLSSAGSAA